MANKLAKQVNLIVPGLFHAFQATELMDKQLPSTSILLSMVSKGDFITSDTKRSSHADSTQASFPLDYYRHFPLAYYEFCSSDVGAGTADNNSSDYFFADLIYLELKTDHMIARPIELSKYTESTGDKTQSVIIDNESLKKIQHIVKVLNEYFEQDDLQFILLPSGRLICQSKYHQSVKTTPVYDVLGRNIKHFLPTGNDERFWLKVFNEIQMLLHEKLSEDERIINGSLINSLWLWGNAHDYNDLINNEANKTTSFCTTTNTPWLKSFVAANNTNLSSLEEFESNESTLLTIIDERFLKASAYGDISLWLKMLNNFESSVLVPLQTLLNSGVISELVFNAPEESIFVYKKYYRYRFYRKNKTLKTLCGPVL